MVAWAGLILVATSVTVPTGLARGADGGVDKVVHFGLYFGLGWTGARALRVGGAVRVATVLGTVVAGLAFGALDEWHQTLLATRQASFGDWLADAAGVMLGVSAHLWRHVAAEDGGTAARAAGGARQGDDPARREERMTERSAERR